MALVSELPVLTLAPKPLIWQWQMELKSLQGAPSAVWTTDGWVDENEVVHPAASARGVRRCPRRIGIVSTGLITRRGTVADELGYLRWTCVILDEAHRARRKNLVCGREYAPAQPNNLLAFLQRISPRTHSLLLATATPVQVHPIEAWDLLELLGRGSDAILGGPGSRWRRPEQAIETLLGNESLPEEPRALWDWIRNPMPPVDESLLCDILRRRPANAGAEQSVHSPYRAAPARLSGTHDRS